jgi:hypothetical protein
VVLRKKEEVFAKLSHIFIYFEGGFKAKRMSFHKTLKYKYLF